ncbi:Prolyl 4-hydroxylase 5 [Raphanus sativus]|nr:Prolyl 4-hydroxylase 5 [Raphanus sativus]
MSDISRATKLLLSPEQNIESFEVVKFQVLHYQVGQKYEPHYDYFLDEFNTKNGGQRIATVLMYLLDVDDGGETVFPAAKGNISAVQWWNELSKCGKEGLYVLPKKRDALLFWNMRWMSSGERKQLVIHEMVPRPRVQSLRKRILQSEERVYKGV